MHPKPLTIRSLGISRYAGIGFLLAYCDCSRTEFRMMCRSVPRPSVVQRLINRRFRWRSLGLFSVVDLERPNNETKRLICSLEFCVHSECVIATFDQSVGDDDLDVGDSITLVCMDFYPSGVLHRRRSEWPKVLLENSSCRCYQWSEDGVLSECPGKSAFSGIHC